MRKPNLFIVGAGRSGTTSIYEWLKSHPEVFMCEVKGPNFFGEEPNLAFPEFHKNEKKYLSLFSEAGNKKVIGEASHYFWSKTAAKEIRAFNLKSKIIIILRNPVDLAYSYYKSGTIPNNISFEESLNLNTIELKKLWVKLNFPENIKNYLKVFGKKKICIILFDEMERDPKNVYFSLCNFLKINSRYLPEFKVYNKSRELKNKWFVWLLQICPTSFKLFIKKGIKEKTKNRIRNSIVKFTTKKQINDTLEEKTRERLKKRFKNMIIDTEKVINRDLSKWLE